MNTYDYSNQDPINNYDLDGRCGKGCSTYTFDDHALFKAVVRWCWNNGRITKLSFRPDANSHGIGQFAGYLFGEYDRKVQTQLPGLFVFGIMELPEVFLFDAKATWYNFAARDTAELHIHIEVDGCGGVVAYED